MDIISEKKIGDEVEVQFGFTADEYDSLYEDYLIEKESFYKDKDYSFEDYFQQLITLILLKEKDRQLQDELKELKKEIAFVKSQIQAEKDANNIWIKNLYDILI